MAAPLPPADDDAWTAHLAAARRLARHLVGADGDDVAQEAAQVACARPAAPGRPAWPWLAGIVRNVARARRRREARRPAIEARAARPSASSDDAAAAVARAELHRQAIDAVLALSEPYRSTLIHRFLDDLAPDEVARRHGVPLETVRTRVRRGLDLVRAHLDARHRGDRRRWMVLLAPPPSLVAPPAPGAPSAPGAPAAPFTPATTVVPSAVPTVLGALLMKPFAGVAVALLLVVGGGGWAVHALLTPSDDDASRAAPSAPNTRDAAGFGEAPGLAAAPHPPTSRDGAPDAGAREAANTLAIDRDLDVAGVVVRADGTPVAGATLTAEADVGRDLRLLGEEAASPTTRVVASTRSAADGAFALRLARGAAAHLRVEAPGLETATLHAVGAGDRLRVVLRAPVTLVVVAQDVAGRPLADAEVAVVRPAGSMTWGYVRGSYRRVERTAADGRAVFADLPAGSGGTWTLVTVSTAARGSLAHAAVDVPERGTVTKVMVAEAEATFRGRVTDAATGAPIAGAVVGVEWGRRPRTTTDADGRYVLTAGNGAAIDALFADAPGYAWTGRPRAGDDPLDFALRAAVTLRGRLVDAAGAPVAGAALAAHGSYRGAMPVGRGIATSGADGGFVVPGLAPGTRTELRVEAAGFGRLGAVLAASDDAPVRDLGDVVLRRARRVEGRVVDALGAPVAGVPVALTLSAALTTTGLDVDAGGAGHGAIHDERLTDDLGRFRFAEVAVGRARLRASPPGRPEQRRDLDVGADDVLDVEFVVEAGRPFRVHVRLPDGTTPETLTVRVVDAHGGVRRASTFRERPATLVVADGPVEVHVESVPLGLEAPPPQTAAPGVDEVTVTLRTASVVTGTVLDPDDRPLPWATIEATIEETIAATVGARAEARGGGPGGGRSVRLAVTDATGRFRVHVPHDAEVVLAANGRVGDPATNVQTRLPIVGDPTRVTAGARDVVLRTRRVPTGRTLRVVVEDPDGRPLAGIPLAASRDDGVPLGTGTGTSDADGVVELRDLLGVPLRVQRGSGTYAFRPTWVDPVVEDVVPDGQTVRYRLRAGTVVTVRVTEPDGTLHRRVRVWGRGGVRATPRWGWPSPSSDGIAVTVDPATDLPLTLEVVEVPAESPRRTAKVTLEALPTAPVTIVLPARPGRR